MAYEVVWDSPGKVLRLTMIDEIPIEIFIEIDKHINRNLETCGDRITLIVDASDVKISPYSIERIKSSQTYLQSYQIEKVLVISNNKLNRLAMLLLFNLCRPSLKFCHNIDQAQRLLDISRSGETYNSAQDATL